MIYLENIFRGNYAIEAHLPNPDAAQISTRPETKIITPSQIGYCHLFHWQMAVQDQEIISSAKTLPLLTHATRKHQRDTISMQPITAPAHA